MKVSIKKYHDLYTNKLRTMIVITHRLETIEISYDNGKYEVYGNGGRGWTESRSDINLKGFLDLLK